MAGVLSRKFLTVALVLVLIGGVITAVRASGHNARTLVVGYFDNSTALFPGDDVRILGVPVGKVDRIEPQPDRVKIWFWFDSDVKVPAEVNAVIMSPQLVTGRAIQLTPAYADGPTLQDGAEIPQSRTAVPVEWDDVREQLQRVNELLQPTEPGGVSTLGEFITTAANNLRGQGPTIRDTIIKLSQTLSALGDHSQDLFATFKNLSTLVTALEDSAGLLEQLNGNLAAATALVADDPNKVGQTVEDLNAVVGDLQSFAADNREALGTTSDKLGSITTAMVDSLDDIEQTLHLAPAAFQNFSNIFEPANGSFTGALAVNNFANPIGFLCGAVQAASRLDAEQSSKLCAQYLAPIMKNRQFNFPPLGFDLFVGAQARPNEVTFSEEWMRPDFVPPAAPAAPAAPGAPAAAEAPPPPGPLAAEAPPLNASVPDTVSTDPSAGLTGLMVPPGGG
ncbi:virulence factor Mce family protein [Mycolicibacterium sp. CR10]|uniref:virulence factor Mce family protein n=1 Tax=Mycolicibacterium sp. CR10 TaxID=2562314 RepID=UPI0035126554